MVVSSQPTSARSDGSSSCGFPGGGIWRPRSFLMAFSQIFASDGMASADIESNATPPAQSSTL